MISQCFDRISVKLTHTKLSVIECWSIVVGNLIVLVSVKIVPVFVKIVVVLVSIRDRLQQERFCNLGDAHSAVSWPPPHLQQHTKPTKQRQNRAGELWFTTVLFDVEQDQDDWVSL